MKIKIAFVFVIICAVAGVHWLLAQDNMSTSEIVTKMKVQLDLSDDQVTYITQVLDRYRMAMDDLQKSVSDNTINPSAIDSQKEQIKAAKEQGIDDNLTPDQLSRWRGSEFQKEEEKADESQEELSNMINKEEAD